MTDALKPCPFCGGDNLYNAHPANAADCGVIACRTCGAEGPDAGPPREFIAAWNRRSDLPVPVARKLTVERVEMEDWSEGYSAPADPIWRIVINGYCADFPTETAARNFANAIGALAPVSVAEAVKVPEIAALVKAVEPFAEAWGLALHQAGEHPGALRTLGPLGALAAHQISGIHFQKAYQACSTLRALAAQEDT